MMMEMVGLAAAVLLALTPFGMSWQVPQLLLWAGFPVACLGGHLLLLLGGRSIGLRRRSTVLVRVFLCLAGAAVLAHLLGEPVAGASERALLFVAGMGFVFAGLAWQLGAFGRVGGGRR